MRGTGLKVEKTSSITGAFSQVSARRGPGSIEVVNDPRSTERHLGDDEDGNQEPEETKYPAAGYKIGTETSSHESGVV